MRRLKDTVKLAIGTAAEKLFPRLVSEIEAGQHTGRDIRLKRWIVFAQTRRAYEHGDTRATEHALTNYWRADVSNAFYDRFTQRFDEWFLGPHQEIVDEIVALADRQIVRQFVEVGCGDGKVLAHCADRLPGIPAFVGVDINPTIIERNKEQFAARAQLHFVAADAKEWLAKHTMPGTILFTYGGVMEYFRAEALHDIFEQMATHAGTAVALVEPLDPAHDLDTDPDSHLFGQEHSFSHNHAALLRAAGFRISFSKEIRLSGIRWIMLIAERPEDGDDPHA